MTPLTKSAASADRAATFAVTATAASHPLVGCLHVGTTPAALLPPPGSFQFAPYLGLGIVAWPQTNCL